MIVRQAEMTKFTHENKAVACCAFSAVNTSAVMYPSVRNYMVLSSLALRCDHGVTNLIKTHAVWQQQ